jgi:RNA polymerase sigma factor (TIGR02999 family)
MPGEDPKTPQPSRLTHALGAAFDAGNLDRDRIYDLVVSELRRIARGALRAHSAGAGIHVTQLIGEVWLRMANRGSDCWRSRDHFVGWASQVVRSILVDQARADRALKRGGGRQAEPMTNSIAGPGAADYDILALDEALSELAEVDPKGARIVELCYFGGLSQREAAAVLAIDESTVKRRWRMARGWLQARIGHD